MHLPPLTCPLTSYLSFPHIIRSLPLPFSLPLVLQHILLARLSLSPYPLGVRVCEGTGCNTQDLEKMLAALKKEKAVAGGGQIMDEIKFLDFAHFAFESTSAAAKTSARVGTSDKRPAAPGPRPPQRMNDLNGRFGISVFQQLEGGLEGSTR